MWCHFFYPLGLADDGRLQGSKPVSKKLWKCGIEMVIEQKAEFCFIEVVRNGWGDGPQRGNNVWENCLKEVDLPLAGACVGACSDSNLGTTCLCFDVCEIHTPVHLM